MTSTRYSMDCDENFLLPKDAEEEGGPFRLKEAGQNSQPFLPRGLCSSKTGSVRASAS